MRMPRSYLLILLINLTLAITLLYATPPVQGEPVDGGEGPGQLRTNEGTAPHEDADTAPKRSIQMQEIHIRGEIEKPKAMFIIPHTPHESGSTARERDFSEEILAPIDKDEVHGLVRYQESLR